MSGIRGKASWIFESVRIAVLGASCAVAIGAQAQTYAYDGLGRLVRVTYPNGSVVVYTYDKAGNRISETVTLPAPRVEAAPRDEAPLATTNEMSEPVLASGGAQAADRSAVPASAPSEAPVAGRVLAVAATAL
jgi:YD repeat-containing protein